MRACLADTELVDNLASNYRVTRRVASYASGTVVIEIDALLAITIPLGATYTAAGQTFQTTQAYNVRTTSAQVIDATTDLLLIPITGGNYIFLLPVTAVVAGAAGNLSMNTPVVPSNLPAGYVTAYAMATFTGGVDAESNTELMAALEPGMAARTFSSPVNLLGMLRKAPSTYTSVTPAFASISAISVIGAGAAEMTRDQHWIFPAAGGGRTDVYLRSQGLFEHRTVTLTATRATGTDPWTLLVPRTSAPGFYSVIGVRDASFNSGAYITPSAVAYGVDSYIDGAPDLINYQEAGCSAYQTANMLFTDDADTTLSKSYHVLFELMPLVKEVQDFLNDPDILEPGGDVLVKAAAECTLTINIVTAPTTLTTAEQTAIKNALMTYVNNLGFARAIYSSQLAGVLQAYLPVGYSISAIYIAGETVPPDHSANISQSASTVGIAAAHSPGNYVSADTVAFFLPFENIAFGAPA